MAQLYNTKKKCQIGKQKLCENALKQCATLLEYVKSMVK